MNIRSGLEKLFYPRTDTIHSTMTAMQYEVGMKCWQNLPCLHARKRLASLLDGSQC